MADLKILSGRRKSVSVIALLSFLCCFNCAYAFAANHTPQTGSITPSSGTFQANQTVLLTSTYSDADGWQDIRYAYLWINTPESSSGVLVCLVIDNLYLYDEERETWLGPYSPGSSGILENSYCKLDCSQVEVSGSGSWLTVKWAFVFKSAFTGNKNSYLYVKDEAGDYEGWTQKGTLTIQEQSDPGDITVPTGSITINNDELYCNSVNVTLGLSAQGGAGVSQMKFSNDNVNWASAQSYSAVKSWTLSSGDGMKTVYVKFKDAAENWSDAYSDKIILDTTKPVITITSPRDGEVINGTE